MQPRMVRMSHASSCLRACRCCLSTNEDGLRALKSHSHILDLLVGRQLDLAEVWLCYCCIHTLRKISRFRDLCSLAHTVLQEYSVIQDSNTARSFFLEKKETLGQGSESKLSMANTLCMSIMVDDLVSQVQIESFQTSEGSPKNYTKDMTVCRDSINRNRSLDVYPFECVMNPGIFRDTRFDEPAINSFESADEISSAKTPTKPLCEIKTNTELKECEMKSVPKYPYERPVKLGKILKKNNKRQRGELVNKLVKRKKIMEERRKTKQSVTKETKIFPSVKTKPSEHTFFPKMCFSESSSSPNQQVVSVDKEVLQPNHLNEKLLNRNKILKSISDEIDKVYAASLSIEEQMKEREDRAKAEPYLSASYRCELCVVTFQSQLALVNHNKKHLESKGPHVCSICTLRFSKLEKLAIHSKSHSVRIICHICEKRFHNRMMLRKHLIWHLGAFKCLKCGETFTDKIAMKEHKRKEHPTEKFECEFCGKTLSSKYLLQSHVQRHRGVPTHVCSICSKGFYSELNLYVHLETHKEKKPLKHYCVECDLHFKSHNILNSHLTYATAHRDISVLKFKCEQCPMAFHTVGFLAQHTAAKHGGERKYACKECGANYAVRRGLANHVRSVHQGYQPPKKFPCPHCEKAFTTKAMMVNHVRVHTGERPFKCPQCLDTFTQKSALGTHIKLVHLKMKCNAKRKKKEVDSPIEKLNPEDTVHF